MKVYVVSVDWAHDGDCESVYGCGVREVYAKREDARKEMERIIKEEIEENPHIKNYKQERNLDGFEAWEDGYYTQEHFCVYVSEKEVYV